MSTTKFDVVHPTAALWYAYWSQVDPAIRYAAFMVAVGSSLWIARQIKGAFNPKKQQLVSNTISIKEVIEQKKAAIAKAEHPFLTNATICRWPHYTTGTPYLVGRINDGSRRLKIAIDFSTMNVGGSFFSTQQRIVIKEIKDPTRNEDISIRLITKLPDDGGYVWGDEESGQAKVARGWTRGRIVILADGSSEEQYIPFALVVVDAMNEEESLNIVELKDMQITAARTCSATLRKLPSVRTTAAWRTGIRLDAWPSWRSARSRRRTSPGTGSGT